MEYIEVIQWVILPSLGAIALQNYRNHGCIKKLEGMLNTHLSQGNKN